MCRYFMMAMMGTSMLLAPSAALAQAEAGSSIAAGDAAAALRAELQMMRQQMEAMQRRLDALESSSAPTQTPATTPLPDGVAIASAEAPQSAAAKAVPVTQVNWRGAPEFKREDGWSFKPRGRIQVDLTGIDAPKGVTDEQGGLRTELRRLYLGVDGSMPGGFGYRLEVDVSDGVELTDAYLTYGTGPLTLFVGQVKTFWGLDEMTSDVFTTMKERTAFSDAFNFERRVGLSAEYGKGDIFVQGGIFSAIAEELTEDTKKPFAADLRVVWSPKLTDTAMLHLGGHVHMRNLNDPEGSVRYRARAGAHTSDVRFVDTGAIDARGERSAGLELAYQDGPLHISTEGYWQKVLRVGGPNPTFFGGYAEAGLVLTKGDKRSYREGVFDRLRPSNPLGKGGMGAIEVNARYDYLNLNAADIVGGKQQAAWLSAVWAPIDYVRVTANIGRVWVDDARAPTLDGDRDYSADVMGLRTQIDF
jgi:phosphate-selective porin OprO/OprP